MLPLVEVLFDANQDFYHASSTYAGLDALARQGLIRLRIRRPSSVDGNLLESSYGVCFVCMKIWRPGAANPLLIAIDLQDQSNLFAMEVLRGCAAYFKRSYFTPDVSALPVELASKVRPFGLNFACRTLGSTGRLLSATAIPLMLRGVAGLRRLRHHFTGPMVTDFEQPPTTPLEPTIIFQTRVWEAETAPGEHEVVNEGRVAIVRALKEAFGDRFLGGLVPSPFALSRYPQEATKLPTKSRHYTLMSKRNLIGIYTVGLHKSTAFKLPEYLAASQCVVAEPPRNELPVPLVPGAHYLQFHTPDECVAACQRLLADGEAAARMRQANHIYYKAHVAPAARMYRVLSHFIAFPSRSRHLFAASGENQAEQGAAPDPAT